MAIVQTLPPRLWPSTAIGDADVILTSRLQGASNRQLDLRLPWWWDSAQAPDRIVAGVADRLGLAPPADVVEDVYATADARTLLERYRPRLVYDSQERYFACSAAAWTDFGETVLRRADGSEPAEAPRLSLSYLGPRIYADGTEVQATDVIAARSRDYARYAVRIPGTRRWCTWRGSHAGYYGPGSHWTGTWFDHADGRGPAIDPSLEVIGEPPPGWLRWPGRWGGTTAGTSPVDSSSPVGPGRHAA